MGDSEIERATEPVDPSPRRRGLHPLLIFVLAVFGAGTASCVGCAYIGGRASAEGQAYAEKTLPIVAQPWSGKALVDRASPEFLRTTPAEKVEALLAFFGRRLGSLQHPALFQNGQWRVFVGTGGVSVTTVHYADCEFEKGKGRVTIRLLQRGGKWRVNGFWVNSDALVQ